MEALSEKLPEGRHYHEFFHEGTQEFCIDFLSILVTFWSPGVLLATLGASLGPRPQFLMNFETLVVSPGPPRATLGGPCGPHGGHGVARDLTVEAFLATSVQHLVFHHFWVAKRYQKLGVSGGADVMKT